MSFSDLLPLVAELDWSKPIAVAVSGGGDSVALAHTIALYRKAHGHENTIHFLTVDHQLRAESIKDIEFVQQLSKELGVQCHVLNWRAEKPKSGVSERARDARRELLAACCHELGINQLLLAHTQNDRLETLLMRVRRGGFRGHSSIPKRSKLGKIALHRPFIMATRFELRNALFDAKLSWIDDPTNDDETYERPRIRRKLSDFDQSGIDFDQLQRYALVMERWRAKIAQKMAFWLLCSIEVNPSNGHLLVKIDRVEVPVRRIQMELVRELVRFVGGDSYLVSEAMAQKATRFLWPSNDEKTLDMPKAFSIGRCVFRPQKVSRWSDEISYWELVRAQRHLPPAIFDPASGAVASNDGRIKWDGRFDITSSAKSPQKINFDIIGTTPTPIPNGDALTIQFRPAVLDGPINEHDWPIFEIFEKKLAGN